jgi:hypothetical protein
VLNGYAQRDNTENQNIGGRKDYSNQYLRAIPGQIEIEAGGQELDCGLS